MATVLVKCQAAVTPPAPAGTSRFPCLYKELSNATARQTTPCVSTYSQLLLECFHLALEQFHLLVVPLGGDPSGVRQLGQAIESLLQPLHIIQQLCYLLKKKNHRKHHLRMSH